MTKQPSAGAWSLRTVLILFGLQALAILFWERAWVRSKLFPLDYSKDVSILPQVIEDAAECSPCRVRRIELEDSELRFVVLDHSDRAWEYRLLNKVVVNVDRASHHDHDHPGLFFDPRADLDTSALQGVVTDLVARTGDGGDLITLRRFYGAGRPVCVQIGSLSRAADGAESCGEP